LATCPGVSESGKFLKRLSIKSLRDVSMKMIYVNFRKKEP
jgi:hypothetical protein